MFLVLRQKILRYALLSLVVLGLIVLGVVLEHKINDLNAVMTAGEADSGPVLIIDPGHGGEDGGAQSQDGTLESHINWLIAEKTYQLAAFLGISSVLTRDAEEIDYPERIQDTASRKVWDTHRRAVMTNEISGAFLISIHQNMYPTAGPSGSQVIYGAGEGSREWGCLTHENLSQSLCPGNRRVAVPAENIFLLENVRCPAILVECGFLSNPGECALLENDSYQKKISAIMIASYLQFVYS